MSENQYILIKTICVQYEIEPSFLDELHGVGLVKIITIEQNQFILQEALGDLEKIIRLHQELNLNIEGIDVVFNLLNKVDTLQNELTTLKNKLYFYENE
ncbi:chaperone modulator CbpM [Formosa sp. PL04]|uniref:chaperone modulator CbpM n=1 Tax=Formosa sp. PL04 TaxID=3081755 RepID=UPI002980D2C6|nr:chaperone modulator CbpM [Formosa sp. PL04]MDW5288669.1 chaperone modulator CbpM [Formosa sp. PL04]